MLCLIFFVLTKGYVILSINLVSRMQSFVRKFLGNMFKLQTSNLTDFMD